MLLERLKTIRGDVFCLLGGMVTPAGFAPFHYYPVPVITLALLFYLSLDATTGRASRYAYLFGLGMFGTGVNWLHISINLFGGIPLAGALFITLLLVLFLALYPAIAVYTGKRLFSGKGAAVYLLALAPLWILTEWARARIFTGFPWLQIAYAHTDSFLANLAPVAGAYGTGLASVFSSVLLVLPVRGRRRVKVVSAVCLVLLWSIAGLMQNIHWTRDSGRDITAALIQGGIPQELKWLPEYRQRSFDLYLELSTPHRDADIIIWPETALPVFYSQAGDYLAQLRQLVSMHDAGLLLGMPVDEPEQRRYYNSALLLSDETAVYHKRHLVPFGEYLPLRPLLGGILEFLEIPMSDFSAGQPGRPLIDLNGDVTAGISICYEATFGSEIIQALPEAEVLINISNDAWFGDSLAPHQHLQMARMRALETGRYLLRGTNTGITAIIDERGLVIQRLEQFVSGALAGTIPLFLGSTPYARTGDMPVILFCILLAVFLKLTAARKYHY